MSDFQILKDMFKSGATVALEHYDGKCQVALIETQHNDSAVTIRGLPDNAVIIKADAFKSPDSVFNGLRGECKRADFVIVADTGKKKVILCIEMKSTGDSETEVIQQLRGAYCFISYCQAIGKVFWQQKGFLDGYTYRYVSIGHISIGKRKTRIDRPTGKHDQPERMLKIHWPNYLQFNQLAG